MRLRTEGYGLLLHVMHAHARIYEIFEARLSKIFNQQWERRFPMPDCESRKVIFHEILLFVITSDYQCFTKLSSSLNLK